MGARPPCGVPEIDHSRREAKILEHRRVERRRNVSKDKPDAAGETTALRDIASHLRTLFRCSRRGSDLTVDGHERVATRSPRRSPRPSKRTGVSFRWRGGHKEAGRGWSDQENGSRRPVKQRPILGISKIGRPAEGDKASARMHSR